MQQIGLVGGPSVGELTDEEQDKGESGLRAGGGRQRSLSRRGCPVMIY